MSAWQEILIGITGCAATTYAVVHIAAEIVIFFTGV